LIGDRAAAAAVSPRVAEPRCQLRIPCVERAPIESIDVPRRRAYRRSHRVDIIVDRCADA
jgi:hypothetical protein